MGVTSLRLDGLYKVEYWLGDAVGRSVMYAHAGKMFGGNSAFAHFGSYSEVDGEVIADISTQRHNEDPNYKAMLGTDEGAIHVRGREEGGVFRFEGSSPQRPGLIFRSVMTPLREEDGSPAGTIGDGGLSNGLYAIHIRALDGIAGGNTGVMLLVDGRILGGDAFYYYLGSYSSASGRWKGEILSQEHTPAGADQVLFGHEVGMGFSGPCSSEDAEAMATVFTGRRSIRFAVTLKLMCRA
jgi:hypothetical protein